MAAGGTAITGTVTFTDGSTILCQSAPVVNGVATCTTTFAIAGAHAVTATFSGGGTLTSTAVSATSTTTITVVVPDNHVKTAAVISAFMGTRNNQILSNGPDGARQIDRLQQFQTQAGGASDGAATGLADAGPASPRLEPNLGSPNFGSNGLALAGGIGQAKAAAHGAAVPSRLPWADPAAPEQPQAGLAPFGFTGQADSSAQFSFSASLSKVLQFNAEVAQRQVQAGLGGDAGGTVPISKPKLLPLDIWMEGHFATLSTGGRGEFVAFHMGADYVVNPRLLVGLGAQYDSLHLKSVSGSYETSGRGWLARPYATIGLSEHLYLQGRLAAGRSDNSVNPLLSYTDSFATTSWLASGAVVGTWQSGPWTFRPSASIGYIHDTSESYADSFGVTIPGATESLGQAKLGPELTYQQKLRDGTVIGPHGSLQAIWNFGNLSVDTSALAGAAASPEGLRGKAELGLKAQSANGLSLDLTGSYDGIGSATYKALEGSARVTVPLN